MNKGIFDKIYKTIYPYLYILPSYVFLGIFTFYPIFRAFYLSFFRDSLASPQRSFIGLDNYEYLFFEDHVFWTALRNNFIYLLTIPIAVGLGLLAALIVDQILNKTTFYKAAIFSPTMIPMAAAAMVWLFIFTPSYGVLNYYLGYLGIPNIDWLGDTRFALPAIMIVGSWKYIGYYMILILAGLQTIPETLYEAGRIEGAVGFKKFRYITLPLLGPHLFFVVLIAIVNSFQVIDQIYLMTRGGPSNATNMLIYYIYQQGMQFWDIGYASAVTSVLFVFLLAVTVLAFKVISKRIHYGGE